MLECRDIDGLMMDWLYEELDSTTSAPFDAHVDGCLRCRGELDSLARTRDAMRAVAVQEALEEPPSSITAILMHEAAKRSPAPVRAAAIPLGDEPGRRGFFGWLASLLDPIVAHPAATAMATLVLVAGVAGSMYLRGEHRVATPQVASHAEAPAAFDDDRRQGAATTAAPAPEPTARMPETVEEAADGYAVDLAPSFDLDKLGKRDPQRELARDQVKEQQQAKQKKTLPVTTNAVSGADPLIDGLSEGEADGDMFEMKVGGELGNGVAGPPPPPKRPATKPEEKPTTRAANQPASDAPGAPAQRSDAAAERAWAQTQNQKLEDAARLKRCRDAAQIANDILDRNPDYYYAKVTGSVSVKSCSGFVTAERNRRARVTRSKAKPKSPAPASGSKDAKAAAQPDEASAE